MFADLKNSIENNYTVKKMKYSIIFKKREKKKKEDNVSFPELNCFYL